MGIHCLTHRSQLCAYNDQVIDLLFCIFVSTCSMLESNLPPGGRAVNCGSGYQTWEAARSKKETSTWMSTAVPTRHALLSDNLSGLIDTDQTLVKSFSIHIVSSHIFQFRGNRLVLDMEFDPENTADDKIYIWPTRKLKFNAHRKFAKIDPIIGW